MAQVAPSILSADFVNLLDEIRKMERAGAEILHVDVMDGHFVPNITVGVPVVEAIRKSTDLVLDVHLMITNPDQMAADFIRAGADLLTVHYETVYHLDRLLETIREKGAKPGVAINPHTPVHLLEDILGKCNHVLIMSVNPGFGAQKFISRSLEKVRKLRKLVQSGSLDVEIEMDGGIDLHNVKEVVENGVDIVVAGSAIFHADHPEDVYRRMQRSAQEAGELRKDDALSL
jgi:ribulose-phosphate 3-epimerase